MRDDRLTRAGAWLFTKRTLLPLPLAALVLLAAGRPSAHLVGLGVLFVSSGEALRLWAVRHIGAVSRTRRDRLGPLVETGPFARVRNPLYLGNVALWAGFALGAGRPAIAALAAVVLLLAYHLVVRWEEALLEARMGAPYAAYTARVPRWIPRLSPASREVPRDPRARARFSWRDTVLSERGTLIAIAAGGAALWLRSRF